MELNELDFARLRKRLKKIMALLDSQPAQAVAVVHELLDSDAAYSAVHESADERKRRWIAASEALLLAEDELNLLICVLRNAK